MSEPIKSLILHVGTDKTGTTSLQVILSENQDILSKSGIYYPITGRGEYYQHHLLFAPICEYSESVGFTPRKTWDENLSELNSEINSRDETTIVLSSELLTWGVDFASLAMLKELFHEITVIIYLRRQDEYVESKYEQSIKSLGYSKQFDISDANIPDYYQLLKKWLIFVNNPENIIVRPYEYGQLYKGSLYQDFWQHALSMEFSDDYTIPKQHKVNSGLTRNSLEFQRLINACTHQPQCNRFLSSVYAYSLSESIAASEPFNSKEILSPQERIEILDSVKVINHNIARDFLQRDDLPLFYEEPPTSNSVWQPYLGLEPENILSIANFIYEHHFNNKSTMNLTFALDAIILQSLIRIFFDTTRLTEDKRLELHDTYTKTLIKLDIERENILLSFRSNESNVNKSFRDSQSHHGTLLDYQNKELSKILIAAESAKDVHVYEIELLQSIDNKLNDISTNEENFLEFKNNQSSYLEKQNSEIDKIHSQLSELLESQKLQLKIFSKQEKKLKDFQEKLDRYHAEHKASKTSFGEKIKTWFKG